MSKKLFSLTLLCLTFFTFFGQEQNSTEPLPTGYQGIVLGLSLDETKSLLLQNTDFGYKGDRDVSLTPYDNQVLIETDTENSFGSVFLTQCWFQFYNDKLYTITININKNKMDYYSMFTTLTKKYGNPTTLDPSKALWEDDKVILILEKPLSLKYIDKVTYQEIQNYSNIQKSGEEQLRQMFLDEF